MKISLLHPSRGRAEKAYHTSKEWIEKSGVQVEHIISVDRGDDDVHNGLYKNYFIWENHTSSIYISNDNNSVVEATNHAAKIATGDILLYLSDDFRCFDNWGLAVQKEFEGVSEPLLIKVDDMLQKFTVPVLTIPIMNRALYERLGFFWHPEYKSMFCDEDLYWTAQKLGAMKMCPHLKFEHAHVSVGKSPDDETYRRSSANWEQGKAVFAKHKALGFPI